MQDNQVTAHFRSCIFRKEVVRKSCDTHQIGVFHHIFAYGCIGRGVQYPLRGDERHNAAFTHCVKAFQEKVVVYRLGCRPPCRVMAVGKLRIEHSHVTKGNIGDSQIKMVHERLLNLLIALHPYFLFGMQMLQYLPCHQVFLKSHDVHIRFVLQYGIHKRANACRRFQYPVGAYAMLVEDVRNRSGYLRWGIEGGQHGLLHGIHVLLILRFVFCVLP